MNIQYPISNIGLGNTNPYRNDIYMHKYVICNKSRWIIYPIGIKQVNYIALAIVPSWGLPIGYWTL